MKWFPYTLMPVAAMVAPAAYANIYLSPEQAQKLMFADTKLTPTTIQLTDAQRNTMQEKSSVHEPFKTDRIWRTPDGSYFVIDEVVGKHEFIKYAVGINADGTVRQVEIMEYTESYGYEVRDESWRRQFVGKTAASPIKLNNDIKNVSGATLSCKHIADGVKRVGALGHLQAFFRSRLSAGAVHRGVHAILEHVTRPEDQDAARIDGHFFTGLRIASDAAALLAHGERTEGRQLD